MDCDYLMSEKNGPFELKEPLTKQTQYIVK